MARAQRYRFSPDYRDAVLATNPVGCWRLGERSGSVARDEMGLNNGTYVNAPTLGVAGLLAGDPNTAVTFAAASTQKVVTGLVTTAVDNWTLAAWVKPTAPGSIRTIIENGYTGNSGYSLLLDASNKLWGLRNGASYELVPHTGPALSTTVPSFAVLLRRAGTSYIYLNGVLSVTGGTNTPTTPAGATEIGVSLSTSFAFDGTLDEPAIWGRALTPAEIRYLYDVGMGR